MELRPFLVVYTRGHVEIRCNVQASEAITAQSAALMLIQDALTPAGLQFMSPTNGDWTLKEVTPQ